MRFAIESLTWSWMKNHFSARGILCSIYCLITGHRIWIYYRRYIRASFYLFYKDSSIPTTLDWINKWYKVWRKFNHKRNRDRFIDINCRPKAYRGCVIQKYIC